MNSTHFLGDCEVLEAPKWERFKRRNVHEEHLLLIM